MAEDDAALQAMASVLATLSKQGQALVLVHGGGKDINRHLAWLGEPPRFKDGLRVTSEEAMKVVEMTLSGYVNKKLVGYLAAAGAKSAGLSGVDGATFICTPLDPELGQVGRITEVNTDLISALLSARFLPVVSPVSVDTSMKHYNVNADDAASALAIALGVERLLFISDVPGVLDAAKNRIPRISGKAIEELVAQGVVQGGMIPKLRGCEAAVKAGVGEVHICGFTNEAALLDQLTGSVNSGTILG